MIYLLAVLTFIATIMFYSFYPRSDGFEKIDKPGAKIAVTELIAQHSAALHAASMITTNSADSTKKMAYESWGTNIIPRSKFTTYLPAGFNASEHGLRPESYILCQSNTDGTLTTTCASHNATASNKGSSDYLITFISLNALKAQYGDYIALLAPRALGEKTYLLDYKTNAHLSTNCGIIEERSDDMSVGGDFDPGSNYVLSNTRYTTVSIPRPFVNQLQSGYSYLACITRLSAAYNVQCPAQKTKSACTAATNCSLNDTTGVCKSEILKPPKGD